jgi:pimeloyl-ACP methyl ester carboxylesterase
VTELNRKVLVITVVLLIISLTPFSLVSTTQAKIKEETHYGSPGAGFTEYYGSIGGANFFVLIPDDWTNPLGDGMLVVLCRGRGYVEDPRDYGGGMLYNSAKSYANQGIAVAASNYGSQGEDRKFGVIRTHQLTEFVIDNYGVTGKVFLHGTSLGGSVALVLGESYPDVYSGVLDVAGVKDFAMNYYHMVETLDENTPPYPSGTGDPFLYIFYAGRPENMVEVNGGTPDEKPQKYAKYSATSHTDLKIPVISLVHLNDDIVLYEQTTYYHSLVGDTWHVVVTVNLDTPNANSYSGDYYGHFDPKLFAATPICFGYLVKWSNGIIAPGDIPPVFPPT